MKIKNIILMFCLLPGLLSCASLQTYSSCDVHVDTEMPILHPAAFNVHLITNQQVTITTEDHKFTFLAQLEINKDRLVLVALTPIGQKLFQIQYRRQELKFERFGIPDTFNPAFLLADVSLIFGDREVLYNCFRQTNLPRPTINAVERLRIIHYSGQNEITIKYSADDRWRSDIVFNNPTRHYQIEIKSLGVENL